MPPLERQHRPANGDFAAKMILIALAPAPAVAALCAGAAAQAPGNAPAVPFQAQVDMKTFMTTARPNRRLCF